jgi:hypothetical protein
MANSAIEIGLGKGIYFDCDPALTFPATLP